MTDGDVPLGQHPADHPTKPPGAAVGDILSFGNDPMLWRVTAVNADGTIAVERYVETRGDKIWRGTEKKAGNR